MRRKSPPFPVGTRVRICNTDSIGTVTTRIDNDALVLFDISPNPLRVHVNSLETL